MQYAALILFCISGYNGQEKEVHPCSDMPALYPRYRRPNDSYPSIIGAPVASPHAYPYQVGMYASTPDSRFFCGGSLITKNYVLTAAHCLKDVYSADVYLGANDYADDEYSSRIVIRATKVIIYDRYTNSEHDIGLLRLSKKVKLNQYIQTITIDDGSAFQVGSTATCSGWGKTTWDTESDRLRYVDLKIIPNAECKPKFSVPISENHICCSGKSPGGPSIGDSGGPLVINGILVGVVAFGSGPCSPLRPSVFTRVSKYSSWIYEKSGRRSKQAQGGRIVPPIEVCVGMIVCLVFVNCL